MWWYFKLFIRWLIWYLTVKRNFLLEKGIIRMEWPACSPDMNPIGHVWDILGRRVTGRLPPQQILQGLERALLEGWDRIPQPFINSIIDSMFHKYSMLLVLQKKTIHPIKKDFLLRKSLFYLFFLYAQIVFFFLLHPNAS